MYFLFTVAIGPSSMLQLCQALQFIVGGHQLIDEPANFSLGSKKFLCSCMSETAFVFSNLNDKKLNLILIK